MLEGANDITTFVSGGTTYAAVASFYDDGVQIVSLTNSSGAILANPAAAGKLADTEGSDELLLDGASWHHHVCLRRNDLCGSRLILVTTASR